MRTVLFSTTIYIKFYLTTISLPTLLISLNLLKTTDESLGEASLINNFINKGVRLLLLHFRNPVRVPKVVALVGIFLRISKKT